MDLLDFYAGQISMRRMVLYVIHDLARMPRLSAVINGQDPARPWNEINAQLALMDVRYQSMLGIMWVGLRLKGKPPPVKPYPIPSAEAKRKQAPPKVDPKTMAYLNSFAPPSSHHRAA